jgi:signal transduction histidine kinase
MPILTRLPLQRRIMLLVAGGLGFTLLAVALVGLPIIAQSTDRILQERLLLARMQAAHLDERLSMTLTRLEGLASAAPWDFVPGLGGQATAPLEASTTTFDLFSGGLIVVDAAGRGIWPDRYRGVVFVDPAVQQALSGRPAVTGLVWLAPENSPAVIMLVPLRDAAGAVAGALGGIIDLRQETLTRLIAPLAFGRTGHAVIVDQNGIVLAGTEVHELFTRGDHPEFFAALIRARRADVGRTPEFENGEPKEMHVMAFAPLAFANWGLGFGQSEWEVFQHERRLQRQLLLLGVALLALGVWFGWRDAGVITAPLRRLTGVAQRIARGDLETPVLPEAGYEVGLLAAALETMRDSLQRTRAELQRGADVIARKEREARALYEVSRAIISEADLSAILSTVASSARSLLGADISAVCLWDSTARLHPGVLVGPREAFAAGEGAPGCKDFAPEGDWQPGRNCPFVVPAFRQVHVTATLRAGDRPVGYMCVGYRQPRPFREEDAGLLTALASLAAIAIRSAQLREQVQQLLVLQERERIGRDLHDSVIQSLYGISLALEHCQQRVQAAAPQVAARLDDVIGALTRVIQEIRTYVMGLQPATEAETLAATLERVIQEFRVNTLLPVEFRRSDEEPYLGGEQRLHLQLLLREALANVARHAGATRVVVEAGVRGGELSIAVSDDGRGFDLNSAARGAGLGLRTMEERARRLGGRLRIDTRPGGGTKVEVRVPVVADREMVG